MARSGSLVDRAHDARGGAVADRGQLEVLHHQLVIGGDRRHRLSRFHHHDLVAVGLELGEQRGGGAGGAPGAQRIALKPFSISSLALSTVTVFFDRSTWPHVWLPIVCPAAATCRKISGCQVACLPIGKKIALVQWAASAARTAGVL